MRHGPIAARSITTGDRSTPCRERPGRRQEHVKVVRFDRFPEVPASTWFNAVHASRRRMTQGPGTGMDAAGRYGRTIGTVLRVVVAACGLLAASPARRAVASPPTRAKATGGSASRGAARSLPHLL